VKARELRQYDEGICSPANDRQSGMWGRVSLS
jgi:hypothetical protein